MAQIPAPIALYRNTSYCEWMDNARRCTVQLGVLDHETGRLVSLGSGVLISEHGLVLTAAHVVLKCASNSQYMVLVGTSLQGDEATQWRFLAQVVTPVDLLAEQVRGATRSLLLDIALVQITGAIVECSPALCSAVGKDTQLRIQVAPFREESMPCLLLGDTSRVKIGDEIWLLAFPFQAKTFMADRKVVSGRQDGHFLTDMNSLHQNGSSGGPALNPDGEVVGIMSCDQGGITKIRDLSLATLDHGFPQAVFERLRPEPAQGLCGYHFAEPQPPSPKANTNTALDSQERGVALGVRADTQTELVDGQEREVLYIGENVYLLQPEGGVPCIYGFVEELVRLGQLEGAVGRRREYTQRFVLKRVLRPNPNPFCVYVSITLTLTS